MKSLPKILSLLTISTMMVSCNEKISPELQSSNSTTVPGPTTRSSSGYVFKLEQTSPLLLRYKMHKTGEGNNDTECKIEQSTFSTSLFKSAPTTYDITCYVEAEEQSLYYNGVDLKLTASPNLCENVVYAPYNFFQYMPGSSTRGVTLYRCDTDLNGNMSGTYVGYDPTSVPQAGCDKAVETGLGGFAVGRTVTDDQDLCDFDYSNFSGPNCDTGLISISEIKIGMAPAYCLNTAYTDETNCEDPLVGNSTWITTHLQASPPTNRLHQCGGKVKECRAGVGLANVASTFKGIIADVNPTQTDQTFEKDISLEAPSSKGYFTNMSISNFVRQCSGSIDNSDPNYFSTAALTATSVTERKNFDPNVLDRYSIGIEYWNPAGSTTDNYYTSKSSYTAYHSPRALATNNVDTSSGWTKTYYAADSFMTTRSSINASGSIPAAAANPFYAFYCLNNSLDIKARIRLVVREWDQFPDYDNQDFELLSDVFYQPSLTPENGRMDTVGSELDEDNNPFNDLNDVQDWDDFFRDQTLDIVPGPSRAFNDRCSAPGGVEQWYSSSLFLGSGL